LADFYKDYGTEHAELEEQLMRLMIEKKVTFLSEAKKEMHFSYFRLILKDKSYEKGLWQDEQAYAKMLFDSKDKDYVNVHIRGSKYYSHVLGFYLRRDSKFKDVVSFLVAIFVEDLPYTHAGWQVHTPAGNTPLSNFNLETVQIGDLFKFKQANIDYLFLIGS